MANHTGAALERRVAEFLDRHGLLDGAPILIGVSGGPDSVCLLHAALVAGRAATQGRPYELHAAHLDHGLRGRASAADAAYVAALCKRLGVPLTSERADVAAYRAKHRLSLEDAARQVRYDFFARTARAAGARAVLVAHTADDQAETVLLHLLRGTGVGGLAGMEAVSSWRAAQGVVTVARPLLDTWREETHAYCTLHRLKPRRDASNWSRRYLRNRVRLELLPLLRRYNPRIDEALVRLARQASETVHHLDAALDRAWPRLAREDKDSVSLERAGLARLAPALQAQALRRAIGIVRGDLRGITEAHVSKALAAASGPAGKSVSLPGGLRFVAGYERHRVALVRGRAATEGRLYGTQPLPLRVPGETLAGGWRIVAELVPAKGLERRSKGYEVTVDAALAKERLTVRTRRPGDRFRPLGMAQAKKLQDYFVDAKAPREERDGTPLVCSGEEIVWVAGQRIGERARVPPGARRALALAARHALDRPGGGSV